MKVFGKRNNYNIILCYVFHGIACICPKGDYKKK